MLVDGRRKYTEICIKGSKPKKVIYLYKTLKEYQQFIRRFKFKGKIPKLRANNDFRDQTKSRSPYHFLNLVRAAMPNTKISHFLQLLL